MKKNNCKHLFGCKHCKCPKLNKNTMLASSSCPLHWPMTREGAVGRHEYKMRKSINLNKI